MKHSPDGNHDEELSSLCNMARGLFQNRDFEAYASLVKQAMGKYPHAPEPHNLMGLLLEKKGDKLTAMKHYRAAWALDPSYIPSRCNMERLACLQAGGNPAFDEADCMMDNGKAIQTDLRRRESDAKDVCRSAGRD